MMQKLLPNLLMTFATLLYVQGCSPNRDTHSQFNSNDLGETARWAAQVTSDLNSVASNTNQIARNAEIAEKLEAARANAETIVGRQISWNTTCGVDESVITILPNNFGLDGKPRVVPKDKNDAALIVLDDRSSERGPDPASWFFQLTIPGQIDRDTAAKLPEEIRFDGTISRVEVERFRDRELDPIYQSSDTEWYVIYIYLSEVKISPAS